MDEAAREVLKKLKPEIKKNLNLDHDILDVLEANDILKSDDAEKIMAERTRSERISAFLFILQRKGPGAFHAFTEALTATGNKFVADMLLDKYKEEERKLDKDSGNSSEESLEPTEIASTQSSNVRKEENTQSILPNVSCTTTTTRDQETLRATYSNILQERLTNRRPSHHALDLTGHPTNHFLHPFYSSRRPSHSTDVATHQSLNGMYTKLKMHLFHMNEREQSFNSSPVPVNFEMVEELLDKLLKLVQDCYKEMGANNKDSLLTNIENLNSLKTNLQQNLNMKEEQVQKYATKILKLETKCKNNDTTIKQHENSIETLRLKNRNLSQENTKLKAEISRLKQSQETEDDTLPKTVEQLSKLNEELKKKILKCEKELEEMTVKFNTLNPQKKVPENQQKHSESIDQNVETTHESSHSNSSSSSLQECKDICAGNNALVVRNKLQKLGTKVLFAEAKHKESRNKTDASKSEEMHQPIFAESKTQEQAEKVGNSGSYDSRRHYNGTSNNNLAQTKLETEKHSDIQGALQKQKLAAMLVKQTSTYKGLKNPKWIRKPLK